MRIFAKYVKYAAIACSP